MSVDLSSSPASKDATPVAANRPSLLILADGGRISSREGDEGDVVLDSHVPYDLRAGMSDKCKALFSRVNVKSANRLVEGQDVTMRRLEQFGRALQSALRETQQNVVALVSTSKAPRYAMAAALALAQEDLVNKKTGDNRSLVIACCGSAMGNGDSPASRAMEDAVFLSAHENMKGRGGVLYGNTLHSLTGLEADTKEQPIFHDSVDKLATEYEKGRWMFTERTEKREKQQAFAGNGGQFALKPGVRTMVISEDPNKQDQNPTLEAIVGRGAEQDLSGIVLKTKSHRNPLEVIDPEVLEALGSHGFPVLVVGKCSGQINGQTANLKDNLATLNAGAYLLDGDGMYSGQAKVVLAEALAAAEKKAELDDAGRMEFIQERLNSYAFMDKTKPL